MTPAEEAMNEYIQTLTETANESIETLQDTINSIQATSNIIVPRLSKLVTKVRESRMAVTTETVKTLKSLNGLQDFLLDDTFSESMSRFRDMIELCERFQRRSKDGTIEAMAGIIKR